MQKPAENDTGPAHIRIRDWHKFQHFKERTPPWIKLYRGLLDDPDWHDLPGESAKALVMLWLIASEDKTHKGNLPSVRRLAFRLRVTDAEMARHIVNLSHFLICDDITAISERYQGDTPETERETETEREAEGERCAASEPKRPRAARTVVYSAEFEKFWEAYPKKAGKLDAYKAFKAAKSKPTLDEMIAIAKKHAASYKWTKENGRFRLNAATWINGARWEDDLDEMNKEYGNGSSDNHTRPNAGDDQRRRRSDSEYPEPNLAPPILPPA